MLEFLPQSNPAESYGGNAPARLQCHWSQTIAHFHGYSPFQQFGAPNSGIRRCYLGCHVLSGWSSSAGACARTIRQEAAEIASECCWRVCASRVASTFHGIPCLCCVA